MVSPDSSGASSRPERAEHLPNGLAGIGWDAARQSQFSQHADAGLLPGRVSRVDGRSLQVLTEDGTHRAEPSAALLKSAQTSEDLPAAGDWVGLQLRPQHDLDAIEVVLPRATNISRTRQVMGSAVERQVVAANIDVAFIVHAANNLNARRLEREVVQVSSSGAEVVILLNKADLQEDVDDLLQDVGFSLPNFRAHAVSGIMGHGVDALFEYIKPNRTIVFIGASGVGKSTLTNRLLGEEVMDTGDVREDDQRGRHTTTARHLIPLPGGGALIDTPGIRSIGLSGADEGVAAVFGDIAELASSCRFNDCSHSGEPGCAIQEALDSGELDEGRLGSYEKLNREMDFIRSKSDVRLRHARRDVWKKRTKNARQRYRARGKFGRSD